MAEPRRRDAPSLLRALERIVNLGHFARWTLISAAIGFVGGLAAIAFHWMIGFVAEHALRAPLGMPEGTDGVRASGMDVLLVLLVPTLGGLLTGTLVHFVAPEARGHGTDSVVEAFHRLRGRVRRRVIAVKALTSAITIGSGGSAGQEGPVAQVGAGVGSAMSDLLRLSSRERRLFMLAGGSAGVGAMFCSPLGGALFMPEVLYRKQEFEGDALVPCIIASIVAFATYTGFTGQTSVFDLDPQLLRTLEFGSAWELGVYLVLGVLCAAVGFAYVKVFYGVESLFERLRRVPRPLRPALGGLLVGVIALAIAPLAGQHGVFFGGYGVMTATILGELSVVALLVLVAAKIVATSLTISSGGSGGVFAPSLAIGALLGALVGETAQELFPGLELQPAAVALVGMGGFFAGVAKTPIAAVLLVCEMTGHYGLLAPLTLVAVVHTLLATRWTLYRSQVADPVSSPAHAGDFVVDVLERMQVAEIMDEARKPTLIHANTRLRTILRTVSDSRDSYFPVVDDLVLDEDDPVEAGADGRRAARREQLVGIFSLTDLRRIMLEEVVADLVVARDFMIDPVITCRPDENLNQVLRKMTANNINAIPIVDPQDEGRVLALLERNALGRAYDRRLQELRDERA